MSGYILLSHTVYTPLWYGVLLMLGSVSQCRSRQGSEVGLVTYYHVCYILEQISAWVVNNYLSRWNDDTANARI